MPLIVAISCRSPLATTQSISSLSLSGLSVFIVPRARAVLRFLYHAAMLFLILPSPACWRPASYRSSDLGARSISIRLNRLVCHKTLAHRCMPKATASLDTFTCLKKNHLSLAARPHSSPTLHIPSRRSVLTPTYPTCIPYVAPCPSLDVSCNWEEGSTRNAGYHCVFACSMCRECAMCHVRDARHETRDRSVKG